MEKCLLRYKRKFKASSLQTRTISGKRGRLVQRIINIPLQITKKSVNIAVNKIKPLNGKHHEGI
jgi:hypothetical protein